MTGKGSILLNAVAAEYWISNEKEGVSKMPNSEQPEGRDKGTEATEPGSAR